MFLADYWLGYWWKIRPKLVRSTLVVSDRYFDDVLVDPQRYRMHRPRAFTRMLLHWIPRPELWLVFDLPSEVLRARQADIATEEAIRQRAEYRRVLSAHENVVFLDASAPLEKVVAQAERAITTQLARRTASQLGLPQETVQNPATTNLLLFFCRRNVPLLSRLVKVVYNSDIQCRLPPDVHLPYPYGIVIHPHAVIGHRVTVMQQATIGDKNSNESVAPIISDDVYVGAGARVLGDVRIGRGVVIGANAVVTRDIPAGATVVGANRILSTERPSTMGSGLMHGGVSSVARFSARWFTQPALASALDRVSHRHGGSATLARCTARSAWAGNADISLVRTGTCERNERLFASFARLYASRGRQRPLHRIPLRTVSCRSRLGRAEMARLLRIAGCQRGRQVIRRTGRFAMHWQSARATARRTRQRGAGRRLRPPMHRRSRARSRGSCRCIRIAATCSRTSIRSA